MYNYFISSSGTTLILINDSISECKFNITLNSPTVLISLTGWINEELRSTFTFSFNIFEISVGFTDPYNSLFSVTSFFTSKVLFFSLSAISLAAFFFSWSFLFKSDFIFSTSFRFFSEANNAFFWGIKKFLA
jgi:hypothetical protein